MWNPNTNENVLGWKFVFGSNTLTSVIRQNPPCFKLFCQLWFQTSASAVFWGLGGKVKYEVVEVSTMFIYSRSLSFCGCLSPAFWLLFALSCHGFGERNLFMLLLQELSQVASLEGLWREAPLIDEIGEGISQVGFGRGVSQVGLGRDASQVGLAMLSSWRPLCSSSAPTQPEVCHLQEKRSYFNRCARNQRRINNQNNPHLSADCVEMVAASVKALVHDFQSVHLCTMVNYHQVWPLTNIIGITIEHDNFVHLCPMVNYHQV